MVTLYYTYWKQTFLLAFIEKYDLDMIMKHILETRWLYLGVHINKIMETEWI